jgi:transketolase
VADTVVDAGLAVQIRRVGIPDCFCESGSIPYLVQRYQMDTENIASAASELVEKQLA